MKVNSLEALKIILDDGITEYGDRYYRYNSEKNEIQYSDYSMNNWKPSNVTLNEFLGSDILKNVVALKGEEIKTHTGKVANYLNDEGKEIHSSNLNGDFYGGFTTMRFSNLREGVEGKDMVFDVVLKELVKYKQELKNGKEVIVHVEWDIKADYSEYIACRLLIVEVEDKE